MKPICLILLLLLFSPLVLSIKVGLKSRSRISTNGNLILMASDTLKSVTVNDSPISLDNVGVLDNWEVVKTIPVLVKIGDILNVVVSAGNQADFAVIMGSLIYTNSAGRTLQLNTDLNWKCNGEAGISVGKNKSNTQWKVFTTIDMESDIITSKDKSKEIKCTLQVYQPTMDSDLKIFVEGSLEAIKINKSNYYFSRKVVNPKLYELNPKIGSNDELTIIAKKITSSLPSTLVATIKYIDTDGLEQQISTNEEWACKGDNIQVLGVNDGSTVWHKDNATQLSKLSTSAKFIWNKSDNIECSILLKKNAPKVIGSMKISVDSYLMDIKVNDKSLPIQIKPDQDFMITRLIKYQFIEGDKIEIFARRGKDKWPGIIASIDYLNKKGELITKNSNSSWTCDGQPAKIFPKQTDICPKVPDEAEWIWNSLSSFGTACTTVLGM